MGCRARAQIIRQLETSKRDGMIAEYLVCWSASSPTPSIAVWSQLWPADYIRGFIAGRLGGMPGDCITIIDEPPPVLVSRRARPGAGAGKAKPAQAKPGPVPPLQ
jgi:hypothetical protein